MLQDLHIIDLSTQLSSYGLNPSHWRMDLEPMSQIAHIIGINDNIAYFKGRIEDCTVSNTKKLTDLELLSCFEEH